MSNPNPTRPRAVTFSQFSRLAYIPNDEAGSKWYSSGERNHFRQALIRDATRVSRALESASTEGILPDPEQLCECIGIEMLMNQGFALYSMEKKRRHVDAVLSEQMLQRQRGVCDLKRLSEISRTGSEWTTERAQKLATGYSKLLND
eukprot:CAMPEP_0172528836 /NCGR_PEP_ID=MMETSP1067-20121228/3078_1 /TAXON_ID=265564 ORGANISM="Thalassiosira punctigera, Strain Tpunct2005C2" /NCGR_SAMPLE_ID=MMETSP1067 /ASSEMBLY_ACC=CAM_ASM_000444 /LENGTH=146 /DNA_ID=CAMNT_0013312801 /DNA_START=796 /DNA_END=1236 /DNA_ORIENTATION=-